MSFLSSAANLVRTRCTGSIRPFNDSPEQEATLELARGSYKKWIKDEEQRTRCNFVLKINGARLTNNRNFVSEFGDHDDAHLYEAPACYCLDWDEACWTTQSKEFP
jgi:hypothetical protein